MAAEIDVSWIDIILLDQEIGGGEHVVDFAEKAFFMSGVVISAAQRWEHYDNARFSIGARSLIVFGRFLGPYVADRIAIATGDPNDRRMFLTILRIGSQ